MKLHIGCGNKYLNGYKHVDIMKYSHIDYLTSADDLTAIESGSADEVYACHVLEHFGRNDNERVLKEWNRVLKIGGELRICVPDFEAITNEYVLSKGNCLENVMGLLYGGQNYKYNFHYQTFDFKRVSDILLQSGFSDVRRYNWQEFLPKEFDDFSRAYIPHMDFENGRLMSLNVVCTKN